MESLLQSPPTRSRSRKKTIYVADSKSVWIHSANLALLAAERAETELSYTTKCKSEGARKLSGSYYTPTDVADFFWTIYFSRGGVSSAQHALKLLKERIFVEPSVGAGALFFSLIKQLLLLGLSPAQLQLIRADVIDLNERALNFVASQIKDLERAWRIRFKKIALIRGDYRNYNLLANGRQPIFFGNPPFVTNPRNMSRWKNTFADFVERAMAQGGEKASLNFIVPLSLTFSRDYRELRDMLRRSKMDVSVASFDNIPDTLFKSGKPKHTNTNKANSQRCSILTVFPAKKPKISATKLHRWSAAERSKLLSSVPKFYDVTDYDLDDQFPRPATEFVARYLRSSPRSRTFASLLSSAGKLSLRVASVARNYIGFRDGEDATSHELRFENKEDFLIGLGILSSDLFFEYWLTIGDGFHLTKTNILNFPILPPFERFVACHLSKIEDMWTKRSHFEKVKLNSGKQAHSFDFSNVALRLKWQPLHRELSSLSGFSGAQLRK
jgi:hypothetical protein